MINHTSTKSYHKRDYRNVLQRYGSVIVEEPPLTLEAWKCLDQETNHLPYKRATFGDTDEKVNHEYFRVKVQEKKEIYNTKIMNIVNSDKMLRYYKSLTDLDGFFIDRCQCHRFSPADYVDKHRDKDSCNEYEYLVAFCLTDQYEGGEFNVYPDYGGEQAFKAPKYSLLLSKCAYPHRVREVTSGERRLIIAFLKTR